MELKSAEPKMIKIRGWEELSIGVCISYIITYLLNQ